MTTLQDAPIELQVSIQKYFPESEWDNASAIAFLESGFNAFAQNNTTDADHPCGSSLGYRDGVAISAENSLGYFQINMCNYPDANPYTQWNADNAAGTAHMLWDNAGRRWSPWYFSAKQLGLI